MILQATSGVVRKPHPEGIHSAVCVDMIELGLMESEYLGTRKWVNKVRLVFETEQRDEEGKNYTLSKTFTASLHVKARLAEFLAKWRGRPMGPGESVDLRRLLGACCTLVVSHQVNREGRTYASIDAVSKPTKKVAPSGQYDPALARQRIAEWKAKLPAPPANVAPAAGAAPAPVAGAMASGPRPLNPVAAAMPPQPVAAAVAPKSEAAPVAALAATADYDPEVGF